MVYSDVFSPLNVKSIGGNEGQFGPCPRTVIKRPPPELLAQILVGSVQKARQSLLHMKALALFIKRQSIHNFRNIFHSPGTIDDRHLFSLTRQTVLRLGRSGGRVAPDVSIQQACLVGSAATTLPPPLSSLLHERL